MTEAVLGLQQGRRARRAPSLCGTMSARRPGSGFGACARRTTRGSRRRLRPRAPTRVPALEEASLPPAGAHFGEAFPPLLLGRGPWVVGRTHTLQPWVEEDEASTTVRVGRRKEHADARLVAPVHRTALSDPTASMTARTSSMVVSTDCTSRTRSERPVPRLSKHEHAAAVGQPLDVSHEEWLVPRRDQIAGNAAHEHDIRRTRAYDLIRDRDVAATCVAHVRQLHGRSVSDRRGALHGIAVDSSSRRAWSWVAVRSQGGQTVALLRRSSHRSNPSPPLQG